jgi:HK97 family phage major capsid protein
MTIEVIEKALADHAAGIEKFRKDTLDRLVTAEKSAAQVPALLERIEELETRRPGGPPVGRKASNPLDAQFDAMFADEGFKLLQSGRSSKFGYELKEVGRMLVKDASFIGGDSYVGSPSSGFPVAQARLAGVADIRRPLDLLSQIPTVSAGPSNTLEYLRLGSENYSAGVQAAEGAEKSQIEYSFVLDSVPVRTYAAYAIASKQVLSDVTELRSFLTSRLAFDVRALLEAQVVAGSSSLVSGLAEEATAYSGSVTTAADRVGAAITSLRARGAADVIVLMHPQDWFEIASERSSSTDEYIASGWMQPPAPTIWGAPVTTSNSVTQNTALVFARDAAKLWVREAITLEIGFVNDQFIRNQVTLLAELRAAFAIIQPTLITSVAV